MNTAKRFMSRQAKFPPSSLIHPEYYYTDAERHEFAVLKDDYHRAGRKYRVSASGPEALYYHHGLRFAPASVKEHIKGKIFVDAGGWNGDSAVVMSEYSPEKILIFEPFEKLRRKCIRTLKRNRITGYELYPWALSDTAEHLAGMDCRTLDDVLENSGLEIGLLKADVEGMGLRLLKGAEQTVRRCRPLLTLSIYHNEDEFAGIYRTLKEWDLDYHFEIKQFSPLVQHGEYSLFAYPAEWNEK